MSESEVICKSSKEVSTGGGAEGGGELEQQIESQ